MLVITRRSAESFNIGPSIHIEVLSVQGRQVHLGISAPKELDIWRDEHARSAAGIPQKPRPRTSAWLARIRGCLRIRSGSPPV